MAAWLQLQIGLCRGCVLCDERVSKVVNTWVVSTIEQTCGTVIVSESTKEGPYKREAMTEGCLLSQPVKWGKLNKREKINTAQHLTYANRYAKCWMFIILFNLQIHLWSRNYYCFPFRRWENWVSVWVSTLPSATCVDETVLSLVLRLSDTLVTITTLYDCKQKPTLLE